MFHRRFVVMCRDMRRFTENGVLLVSFWCPFDAVGVLLVSIRRHAMTRVSTKKKISFGQPRPRNSKRLPNGKARFQFTLPVLLESHFVAFWAVTRTETYVPFCEDPSFNVALVALLIRLQILGTFAVAFATAFVHAYQRYVNVGVGLPDQAPFRAVNVSETFAAPVTIGFAVAYACRNGVTVNPLQLEPTTPNPEALEVMNAFGDGPML